MNNFQPGKWAGLSVKNSFQSRITWTLISTKWSKLLIDRIILVKFLQSASDLAKLDNQTKTKLNLEPVAHSIPASLRFVISLEENFKRQC